MEGYLFVCYCIWHYLEIRISYICCWAKLQKDLRVGEWVYPSSPFTHSQPIPLRHVISHFFLHSPFTHFIFGGDTSTHLHSLLFFLFSSSPHAWKCPDFYLPVRGSPRGGGVPVRGSTLPAGFTHPLPLLLGVLRLIGVLLNPSCL